MKLKEFNKTNTDRFLIPKIRLSTKKASGLNRAAVKLLKLTAGKDRISLFQDEENKEDWYIAKTKNGFPIYGNKSKKSGSGCTFSCRDLVNVVKKSIDYYDTLSCIISEEPIEENIGGEKILLYPIITSSAKKREEV